MFVSSYSGYFPGAVFNTGCREFDNRTVSDDESADAALQWLFEENKSQ